MTGGAQGIGRCICEEFRKAGAKVCIIDRLDNAYFKGDMGEQDALERFAKKVVSDYGHVDYLINNAAPMSRGIEQASYEDFEYALKVGVTAPFYLAKLFLPYFAPGGGHCQYFLFPGSDEPTADGKLYCRQGRNFCADPRSRSQLIGKGAGKRNLSRMD